MAFSQRKRLTSFVIIGMLTSMVVIGLWVCQKNFTSSAETQAQMNSRQDNESLESPSECPPMTTSAEGGGPEKCKLPNVGLQNTWMISFSAQFDENQAKEINKQNFIGLFYDSSNTTFHTKRIEEPVVPSGYFDSEDDQPVYHWPIDKKKGEFLIVCFLQPSHPKKHWSTKKHHSYSHNHRTRQISQIQRKRIQLPLASHRSSC